MKGILSLMIKN